jgi:predicted acetyltransferase
MVQVALCREPEQFAQGYAPIGHYFGSSPSPSELARIQKVFDYRRTLLATEGERTVGGCGAHAYELTVPGGVVRAAGITIVGVQPTHRRRGILREMMRTQLDLIREWGEPVAFLWASEETIYGRFGYGMASLALDCEIPKTHASFSNVSPSRGELLMVTEEDAYAPISAIYERVRLRYPGMFSRSENWWKYRRLKDPEHFQGGPLNRVVLRLDGEPQAYALYRMHQSLERGVSKGFVQVLEAIGTTPEATREIWSFLLNIDWVASVRAALLPVDHPLRLWLTRLRMANWKMGDALWVRLVDVEAALAARFAQPPAEGSAERRAPAQQLDQRPVVLEVHDTFCPWNEGRYRIGSDGVARTSDDADLALEVNALGSVYLGGFSFRELLEAERIVERSPGAAAAADRYFASDRAPWCPEIF